MLVFGGNDVDTSYNDLYFLPINVQVPDSDLSDNFHKMFLEEIFTDVTFVVEGKHRVKAHRCVLASRS